jgi:hypothetical protein
MSWLHLDDLDLEFTGHDATRFAPFPLVAWFYRDVLHLPERFQTVTVARRRNWRQHRQRVPHTFSDAHLCLGMVAALTLGLEHLGQMDDRFHDEGRLAEVLGLPAWFDQSTAHRYLNAFQGGHVRQLRKVNTGLLRDFSLAAGLALAILDVDSTTHSLESQHREGAVPGYNKIKPGKPCYQWFVGSVGEEIITHRLDWGNAYLGSHVAEMMTAAEEALPTVRQWVLRTDGIFFCQQTLNTVVSRNWLLSQPARWNWLVANCPLAGKKWEAYDEHTRLLDFGIVPVLKGCTHPFRAIGVETRQDAPGRASQPKVLRYGIVNNLFVNGSPAQIYDFQHDRGGIENLFQHIKEPLSARRMPSQKFRGNEAWLEWVQTANNGFIWFKKSVCLQRGKLPPWSGSAGR